jgi:choline dehydrogenase-like flavoprotein
MVFDAMVVGGGSAGCARGPAQQHRSGGVFGVVTGLLSPSSRGRVRLRSADPDDPPRIDAAYLRTPDDVRRMVEATRHARLLGRTAPLVDIVRGAEIPPARPHCVVTARRLTRASSLSRLCKTRATRAP